MLGAVHDYTGLQLTTYDNLDYNIRNLKKKQHLFFVPNFRFRKHEVNSKNKCSISYLKRPLV